MGKGRSLAIRLLWLAGLQLWMAARLGSAQAEDRCPPLSKELLQPTARNNMIMVTAVDQVLYKKWIPSNVASAKAAGIDYQWIAALDNKTAVALRTELGIKNCFVPDLSKITWQLNARDAADAKFTDWGNQHWHETTWTKVKIVHQVFQMGFHVIHADSDITWFNDPYPYFKKHIDNGEEPPHMIVSLDTMDTENAPGENDVEKDITPYQSINTGVYFIKQWRWSAQFFAEWFDWYEVAIMNDQHALNHLIRGKALTGDKTHPVPFVHKDRRMMCAAFNHTFCVSFLPVSQFGNSYTFIKGRLHQVLNHTLYEVHWVWSGAAYNKQQNMRDAGVYLDPPEYYQRALPASYPLHSKQQQQQVQAATSQAALELPPPLTLLTMDLDRPEAPPGFNELPVEQTEQMIRFHVSAVNAQLQQLYWGFMAAAVLNRTFVMPKANCFCSRNWYRMFACRINGEKHTRFPFTCTMHDILRTRFVIKGLNLPQPWGKTQAVQVREYSFLENPRTPQDIKTSRLIVDVVGSGSQQTSQHHRRLSHARGLRALEPKAGPDGIPRVEVPAHLMVEEVVELLKPLASKYRVIHIPRPSLLLGAGYSNTTAHFKYDEAVMHYATFWCCRDPMDMKHYNVSDRERFVMLPPSRQNLRTIGGHHLGGDFKLLMPAVQK